MPITHFRIITQFGILEGANVIMEKIKDRIYDAYYSEKGEEFGKKVRERIHWITQRVRGVNVLDIGCSQGITGILLAREGKKVFAIDSSTSAIEDAKNNLLKEEKDTQNFVHFEKANFFIYNFKEKYDSVILGEVLEHITDINNFFSKASSLVKENGYIIITTPFGINDFIDHKRTFYLNDFLELQSESLYIEEVKFFGKWIGVVYRHNPDGSENKILQKYDKQLWREFEKAVYNLEEDYIRKNKELKKRNAYLSKLLKDSKEESADSSKIEIQKYHKEKEEKLKIQKELYEAYSENESILQKHKKVLYDYETLLDRYHNLKNSKLGKLTTKYWQFRNKKRRN
ncbi:methyltransferase [Roseburia sp. 1XD42-34]|nr:methyltransferase [Roseburia sp. 1XD42-34]RKI80188.1 methyltransferase [Clostridium sp. 1xD42-85]